MKYFAYIGCSVLSKEISQLLLSTDNVVDLRFLPAGLHEQPQVLNRLVRAELEQVEKIAAAGAGSLWKTGNYDAVLIGFGLCNQAVIGLQAKRFPLVIPRAHDCIQLLLGSKERYLKCSLNNPANYWFSAGWIERLSPPGGCREAYLEQVYQASFDREQVAVLQEVEADWKQKYSQATLISWDLPQMDYYREITKNATQSLNWQYQELAGDPRTLRDFINGAWDDERFLYVPTGSEVVASHDERLIIARSLIG